VLKNWRWWSLALTVILVPHLLLANQNEDLLDLSNGALVLSATTYHGGRWNALSLLDGTQASGWSSIKGNPYPNIFVVELAQHYLLHSFVVDNTGAAESNLPGISAREFELYGSTTSSEEGFYFVLAGKAAKGTRKVFTPEQPVEVRWLKLVILSNWGNPSHTELMELEAYGEPVGEVPQQEPFHGIYSTNYGLMRLEQLGNLVKGCYDGDHGRLSGSIQGRILRFRWQEDGPNLGTAIMVLSSDGNFLNGLWYEKGLAKGIWYGRRVTDYRRPKCKIIAEDFVVKSIYEPSLEETVGETAAAESLAKTGLTSLSYIHFDIDSATIKPEFTKKLEEDLAVLQKRPSQRITVEGHTDSTHTKEYNLELSMRRALAVVDWLTKHGVHAQRLEAKGYGKSRPVGDNSTPEGRARNRRVEIRLQ
jgi:outer membrane protein OmpA-like peptidoglycan-associated protein